MNMKATTRKNGNKKEPRTAKSPLIEQPQNPAAGSPTSKQETAPDSTEPLTEVAAKIDVGFGNQLYIRGQGGGLSWDRGMPLQCASASTWIWFSERTKGPITFKLLLNDQVWANGEDLVVAAGQRIETVPQF